MCGDVNDYGYAEIESIGISAPEVIELATIAAAPIGIAITLAASAIVLRGPRRWLSVGMLLLIAIAIACLFSTVFVELSPGAHKKLANQGGIFAILCAAFIILSAIWWPSKRRIVNFPMIIGIGISVLGIIALVAFF